MGAICVLGVDDNKVLKDFVRAHVELLHGPKVCVGNWYPDYTHDGRTIRHFHSRSPLVTRARKLLPHAIYSRLVTRKESSYDAVHDALEAFMRHHNVDVILAEFGPHGARIAPHARQMGIPLIVHFHGHDAHRSSVIEASAQRYRDMFESAFRIVTVSRYMTDTLVAMGADPNKVVLNPYGPRDAFFSVKSDYSPVVLSVGRFTDIKANHLTLAAFREALNKVPEARMVMVGEGELLETCRSLAKLWGIADSVTFTGAVPHAQVIEQYAHARCFAQHSVSPSYGDAEGTPVAVLEAGAAALPVVATRHAGIPDVVIDGTTGYLCDEGDVTRMADAMVTLLRDKDLAQRMGSAGRERVREHFPMERHIAVLQRLVDEARRSKRRAA